MTYTPTPVATQAGWHADPWSPQQWRWWDGYAWTVHVAPRGRRKPRLPDWLSPPVLAGSALLLPALAWLMIVSPWSVILGLVPIIIVLPVMTWLDRVEPEPRSAIVHAFAWGASIAVLVSGVVNTIVFLTAGEVWGAVVSAPIIEEIMKALGIVWAVRRREVDGIMDGIVYAGWVALGFAVVEDMTYFAESQDMGLLATTFVVRALLGPFAHPLFTAWTGIAIGHAISRGRPIFPAMLWGLALAIASHMIWNGSLMAAAHWSESGMVVLLIAVAGFVTHFFVFVVVLYRFRRRSEMRFNQLVPWLAHRYHIPQSEVAAFANFRTTLTLRRALPRAQRRHFDAVHAALARLAVLHDRPGGVDPTAEALLLSQLQRARLNQQR